MDVAAVRHAVEADCIITDGFRLRNSAIKNIRAAYEKRGIIILTDPDTVGERIRDAMRLYVRRVIRQIGSLIAMMNGIDMLVFTAGVGENSAEIRRRILEGMTYFGIKVDQEANKANAPVISTPDSAVKVVIQPTNEEWIAARHAVQLLLGKEQQ